MTDITYTIVKASARRGRILTPNQLSELASAKDLKELMNRLKEKLPGLDATKTTTKDFEDTVYKDYLEEVEDFIKASPKYARLFNLFKREITDLEKAELVKSILTKQQGESQPAGPVAEELVKLAADGYQEEVVEATKIFEKYKIPGLVDAVFGRQRLMKLFKEAKKTGREARNGIKDFLAAKVDFFNAVTIVRGVRNGIPPEALESLLIYGLGNVPDDRIKEALRLGDLEKTLRAISEMSNLEASSPRDLEKAYEAILAKISERSYYKNYTNLGAVLAYLELKLRETKSLVRIANILDRNLEARKIFQEYIY